jgi:proteic killer suppression protein
MIAKPEAEPPCQPSRLGILSFPLYIQRAALYPEMVIRSFRSKETEKVFRREFSRKLQGLERAARRRLEYLDAAKALSEIAAVPGYHLEALAGDRKGQYSMRINDPWRICFAWKNGDAFDVEIADYH